MVDEVKRNTNGWQLCCGWMEEDRRWRREEPNVEIGKEGKPGYYYGKEGRKKVKKDEEGQELFPSSTCVQ